MDKIRIAKFQIGQVVRHRVFPFRGVTWSIVIAFALTWRSQYAHTGPCLSRSHWRVSMYALRLVGSEVCCCGGRRVPQGGTRVRRAALVLRKARDLAEYREILTRYPTRRAALMPTLPGHHQIRRSCASGPRSTFDGTNKSSPRATDREALRAA